jgi:hypothetical protein
MHEPSCSKCLVLVHALRLKGTWKSWTQSQSNMKDAYSNYPNPDMFNFLAGRQHGHPRVYIDTRSDANSGANAVKCFLYSRQKVFFGS